MNNLNAIIAIASRDVTKLLRDRPRMIISLIFPMIFLGILGTSLQSSLGNALGFNILLFTFTGIIAQTLFQSTASGIISLVEDRDNDFAQEIFVSPVSRYAIIFGKILGESLVSCVQIIGIIIFAALLQIPVDFGRFFLILPAGLLVCLFGGAFGVIVMSNLSGQRSANQVFPFIIFPQIFLSGVFSPIKNLPPVLSFLSHISPMTYAVDFFRSLYYQGLPEAVKTTLYNPILNLVVIFVMFTIFLTIGTSLFVRNERNR